MANQELDRKDVRYCFDLVKGLIEDLPKETFEKDSKLKDKKEKADAALVLLGDFFNKLPSVNKDEVYEFIDNIYKFKEMFVLACGKRPTINSLKS